VHCLCVCVRYAYFKNKMTTSASEFSKLAQMHFLFQQLPLKSDACNQLSSRGLRDWDRKKDTDNEGKRTIMSTRRRERISSFSHNNLSLLYSSVSLSAVYLLVTHPASHPPFGFFPQPSFFTTDFRFPSYSFEHRPLASLFVFILSSSPSLSSSFSLQIPS